MKRLHILILLIFSFLTENTFIRVQAFTPAVVKIHSEDEIKELEESGAEIYRRRGDILLCLFPDDDDQGVIIPNSKRRSGSLNNKFKLKGYGKRERGFNTPSLDIASQYYGASDIRSGKAYEKPLTGKGVVVGFCDIGIDPLHPTFLDENGRSRIKRITHYKEFDGERLEMEGDEAYKDWVTDTTEEYHASHVGGILAGNGGGSQFIGMAPDADIVVSLSSLTDFGLLMGVEDIIDYAKAVNLPCVINLSMGSYTGAHDGSSLFSQYLDLCADDAIFVLSAGNEGNKTNTLSYLFTEDKPHVSVRLGNRSWNQKEMYGLTDIWNSSESPLTINMFIYDDETKEKIYEFPPLSPKDWEIIKFELNPEDPFVKDCSLEGYIEVTGGIDAENDRYNAALIYEYNSPRLTEGGWGRDVIGFKVEGKSGEKTEIYSDGTYTRLMKMSGEPSPSSAMSISDLVCGKRVISVGMYENREKVPLSLVDSETGSVTGNIERETECTPLAINKNSSYGTLNDGRVLPMTVAPGAYVMSACGMPFIAENPTFPYFMDNGAMWTWNIGTSMSAPYVAGCIASWLQAFPELTSEDIMEAILVTNDTNILDNDNPRIGKGYFNAAGAFSYIVKKSGVNNVPDPSKVLSAGDLVDVYNMLGQTIYKGRAEGCNNLQPSLYIIKTPYGSFKSFLPGLIFHR